MSKNQFVGPELGVDVWTAQFNQSRTVLAGCVAALCPSEIERASRFATAELRSQFAFNRGALRYILSDYTHESPERLKLDTGPYGKPLLRSQPFCFNVTHSGLLMVCAVSRTAPVGIDIEHIREMPDMFAIANGHFAPGECERLRALPALYRTRGFFECWTRKEAFIKATGLGLSQGLHHFEVTFGPGVVPRLVRLDGRPDAPEQWELHTFDLPKDYCGAVAVGARNIRLRFHQIELDRIAGSTAEVQRFDALRSELLAGFG
jgi:4'-phosphopantetheinyl transferase